MARTKLAAGKKIKMSKSSIYFMVRLYMICWYVEYDMFKSQE